MYQGSASERPDTKFRGEPRLAVKGEQLDKIWTQGEKGCFVKIGLRILLETTIKYYDLVTQCYSL